ncbi:MAG: biopolymer transporter ExbD [Myxococcales bacterium]|nr:biopolymer transporter ExbD [Myxococcales bacterium]
MADINVTPLIDVVLVLLVVFMVITPMLSSGLPVDLPMATSTVTVNDAGQHIVISVTRDLEVAVDQDVIEIDESITGDARMQAIRDRLLAAVNFVNQDRADDFARCREMETDSVSRGNCGSILVKADANLEYGQVRQILDFLAENRFTSVFIAAGKEK